MKTEIDLIRRGALLPGLLALAAGCGTAGTGDDDPLEPDELSQAVDAAVDYVDGELEQDGVAAMSAAASSPLSSVRQRVRDEVIALAHEEPCALRGVIAGLYDDSESGTGGPFAGLGVRRDGTLVGTLAGTWAPGDGEAGGLFAGEYAETLDDGSGALSGTWAPGSDDAFGTFSGSWVPDDDGSTGGNAAGVWHPWEGRGVFIGYYSRCEDAGAG